jgi:hypothetical protein
MLDDICQKKKKKRKTTVWACWYYVSLFFLWQMESNISPPLRSFIADVDKALVFPRLMHPVCPEIESSIREEVKKTETQTL